ncbi:TetR family transcriptional regulator [Nonomuraea sp. NN258]|uniref:TetR/AcrR family transcriptional regulator C-terminal domain-containing protein n=1 Tax=Nonomuraea antri TaxID=2730852 RepID=UPI00156A5B9F|nr:TetR/AcrR family transcriptional regulator C-terminal domain-containing protein [Nonomuraea antri]NRQ38454.1 TetR family transcriptional regulator [Nonomuraea antri]
MTGKQFSSVWLREPRKTTSPGRSREEIIAATLELLDAEGLNGLSMRKLGAKLSAGATSLYWYVANKDELLELVYDEIWGDIELPDPAATHWRQGAALLARSMRAAILRHPWSADLIGRMAALGPNALGLTEKMRQMFSHAGFAGLEIDYANSTLTAYVFGITIPEVAWNNTMADREYDPEEMRSALIKAAADFPDLLASADQVIDAEPGEMRAMAFEFGLASVLDGLERRLVT